MTKYINNKTTKKRNSIFRLLTSVAIVMLMSVSMILPAFAEPEEPQPPWMIGEPGAAALSAISKKFDVPIGTTIPEAKFIFILTPEEVDGVEYDKVTPNMPAIEPVKIEYEVNDKDAIIIMTGEDGKLDTKSALKESADLAKDVEWPGEGVYVYTIVESEEESEIKFDIDAVKQGDSYSKAEYKIEFWVFENEDKPGEYYVKYVNAFTVKDKVDVFYAGKPGGFKVDPTPDRWDEEENNTIEGGFSGVIFTNGYWKSDGPGPEDPDPEDAAFLLTKKLAGHDIDGFAKTYFKFDVTVTQPRIVTENQVYLAYVIDAKGDVVTSDKNYEGTLKDGFIEFTSDDTKIINLIPGEKLIFVDLHVGATVTVKEHVNNQFVPSYVHNFNGIVGQKGSADDTMYGFTNDKDEGPHYLPEGNETNAVFTNTRVNTTPTGLNVDDLPYIVLIGLAIAGLAGFIVFKARSKRGYDV